MNKCTECPECGCSEYVYENDLGEGYRICVECKQEWYTTINYKKYKTDGPSVEEIALEYTC